MNTYASFGLRLLAFIIDSLIVAAILSALFALLPLSGSLFGSQFFPNFASPARALSTLIVWTYYVFLTKQYGATVGKMAFGLKVVRTDGQPLDWQTVLARETAGKLISGITLGLGYLWVSWDGKKQGFHDKIADTYVIKL